MKGGRFSIKTEFEDFLCTCQDMYTHKFPPRNNTLQYLLCLLKLEEEPENEISVVGDEFLIVCI